MDGRGGEEIAQLAGPHEPEHDLNNAGDDAHGKRHFVRCLIGRRILPAGEAERRDGADDDDDQTRRRAFDRQFRIAEERRDDRADDGREDAGDRREARGDRNAQAEGERDQEDEEARQDVLLEVLLESGEIAAGDFALGNGSGHGFVAPTIF